MLIAQIKSKSKGTGVGLLVSTAVIKSNQGQELWFITFLLSRKPQHVNLPGLYSSECQVIVIENRGHQSIEHGARLGVHTRKRLYRGLCGYHSLVDSWSTGSLLFPLTGLSGESGVWSVECGVCCMVGEAARLWGGDVTLVLRCCGVAVLRCFGVSRRSQKFLPARKGERQCGGSRALIKWA